LKHHLTTAIAGLFAAGAIALAGAGAAYAQETQEIRWATSSVDSAGHRALVSLSQVLNREMDEISITVMPTPGAAASVRGFAAGEFDGYYGADVAFVEIANDTGRYVGFEQGEHELAQSFWAYTLEMGLGVRAADAEGMDGWRALSGRPVFTSPAPWDTRAALERAMNILEVGHNYVELDTGLSGQSVQDGTIDAMAIYTTGETSPAPWVQEALLTTDIHALNPSDEEIQMLEAEGISVVRVPASAFDADIGVEEAVLVPFYYGFHVGMNVDEDVVYKMLETIEANIDEIVQSDPGLSQLQEDLVGMQVRGIESVGDAAPIHPGLARFLRDRDAWNDEWDDRVAG
jgi:TRAP-type uncharacterized transport system substrate-binding protein